MSAALGQKGAPSLADHFWQLSSQPVSSESDPVGVVDQFLASLEGEGQIDMSAAPEGDNLVAWLRSQELSGDLTYASPEQARGEPLDQRSLVFSVGVLLFERLTGRHPFGVEHNKRIARLRNAKLASGVNYFPKIPAELRAVVVKAIAAFPEERWHNLADLKRQLEACVQLLRMPEAQRALRVRALPAIPDRHATPVHSMSPLRGDSRIDGMFAPVETREISRINVRLATAAGQLKKSSAPLLWMAIGGLVAAGITAALLLGARSDEAPKPAASIAPAVEAPTAPAAAPAAAERVADSTPAVASAAAAAASKADDAQPPRPSADEPAQTEPPAAAVASAPAGFDIDAGGVEVARAARACFAPSRLAKGPMFIGATLVFDAKTGVSRKAYLGAGKFTQPERGCLLTKLKGLSAGGPPAKGALVHYDITLSAKTTKARGRIK